MPRRKVFRTPSTPPSTSPKSADERDVLREQLEYLIDHVYDGTGVICNCSLCAAFYQVREKLLWLFKPKEKPAWLKD